jgi:hypothetical protein
MFGKKASPTKPEEVRDTCDLAGYLKHLADDFENNSDRWENISLDDYLRSIARWIEDSRTVKEKKLRASDVANLFLAGSMYE